MRSMSYALIPGVETPFTMPSSRSALRFACGPTQSIRITESLLKRTLPMRTFARKAKDSQRSAAANPSKARFGSSGHSPALRSLLRLQRSGGRTATQLDLKSAASRDAMVSPEARAASRTPHLKGTRQNRRPEGFSNADIGISSPQDRHEKEAERAADQVTHSVEPRSSVGRGKAHLGHSDGRPRSDSWRSYFESRFGYDFSQVRVHHDSSAWKAAESINAKAFTVGPDIVFGPGQFAPQTSQGRRLLAHELTHVIQQGSAVHVDPDAPSFSTIAPGRIQRAIAAEDLERTPVERIMADETYFENGIRSMDFYGAEVAILHYDDGSQIRLGLVPDEIEPPFEAVDYRSLRSAHIPISENSESLGTGSILFLPKGAEAQFPEDASFGDLPAIARDAGRTIRFTHHPSGRIVPTEVNSISAPRLSGDLRWAESEYVRRFDAMAARSAKGLKIIEVGAALGTVAGGLVRGGMRLLAGRTGAAATARVLNSAKSSLVSLFKGLLKSGTSGRITVEGVGISGIRVSMRGSELTVTQMTIVNASRIPGQGRLIHRAFEQAAIEVARQSGASTARVALKLVQNKKWAAYLESQGYAFQTINNASRGFSRVLTKVFTV